MYQKKCLCSPIEFLFAAAVLIFGQISYADDLELVLDKNVADKYLSEVAYPYVETIDTSKAVRESGTEADIKIDEVSSNFPDLAEVPEVGDEIAEQLSGILLDEDKSIYVASLGAPTKTFLDALTAKKSIASAIASGDAQKLREAIGAEIASDKSLEQQMLQAMRDWVRVDVDWVKVRIDGKPQSNVSDPIVLSNLSLGVKARLRGCVKIKKWFCTKYVEVGFIHLQAAKLTISMLPRPPKLFGQPAFSDLDIVWSFKLLKKTYSIRVGITRLVNKSLGSFQLADFSDFEIDVVGGQKKLKVSKIGTEAASNGLKVKVMLAVQP